MNKRNVTFEDMQNMNLIDILQIYIEAKSGKYIELEDVLTCDQIELITELDLDLNVLIDQIN